MNQYRRNNHPEAIPMVRLSAIELGWGKQACAEIKACLRDNALEEAQQIYQTAWVDPIKRQHWSKVLWESAMEMRLSTEAKEWLGRLSPLVDSLPGLRTTSFLGGVAVFNPDLLEQLSNQASFTYWWVALQASLSRTKVVDADKLALWERLLAGERKQAKDLSSIFHTMGTLMNEPLATENYPAINWVMKKAGIHGWIALGEAFKAAKHQLTAKKVERVLKHLDNQDIAWITLENYAGSELILPAKAAFSKQQLNQTIPQRVVKDNTGKGKYHL